MSEGLTYTEAKKIVNDWRKDFACNVSEGYIISAFLDDAAIIKKLRAELAATTARVEKAEAERDALALVDEYGHEQWLSGVSGNEFEAGPDWTFAEWLAEREEQQRYLEQCRGVQP